MNDDRLPFRAEENALVRFGDPGTAPLLNYNVPQPAEYNGRYFLDLLMPAGTFKVPPARPAPDPKPNPVPKPDPKPDPDPKPSPGPTRPPGSDYSIKDLNDLVVDLVTEVDLSDLINPIAPLRPDPGPLPVPGIPDIGFDPMPPFDRIVSVALARLPNLLPRATEFSSVLADAVIQRRLREMGPDAVKLAETAALRPLLRGSSLVPGVRPVYLRRLDALVGRLGAYQFARRIRSGERLVERRTLNGELRYELLDEPTTHKPRLALIHLCRLSSYLGEYGAGRTISTFSLLPGEKHDVEVKTYKRTKSKQTEASSILDSYEEETADEFQSDLTQESSTSTAQDDSLAVTGSVQAAATWGWGSANASGTVSSTSASKREDFAKNVASSTQKHAAKAAAKRQLEVNTSSETETEEGEERALKRSIENINVGRTLNFVMRQMNQVFVSVLSVTDIRIGYANGQPGHYQEYTLPELAEFLEQQVVPTEQLKVKSAIWNALYLSFDWQSQLRPLVEAVSIASSETGGLIANATLKPAEDPLSATFWRFARQTSKLDRTLDGVEVSVPGVVLDVTRSVLPTDGLIVESLLGQGNALDAYSMGLQVEAVRSKLASNDLAQAQTDLLRMKLQVVTDLDNERAALLQQLFPIAATTSASSDG